MEGIDRGLVEFLFNQGVGVAFGIACLLALVFTERRHGKEKDEWMTRLKDLLHERKSDRDATLELMGRNRELLSTVGAQLSRMEPCISLVRHVAEEYGSGPRRRETDRVYERTVKAATQRMAEDDDAGLPPHVREDR